MNTLPQRHAALIEYLAQQHLDGVLVPHADRFQSEELPLGDDRLRWLSGFSGSAGMALVHRQGSVLLVDGRYTLQAPLEVDAECFMCMQVPEHTPAEILVGRGGRIGFDPWLHTTAQIEPWQRALVEQGGELVPLSTNPIDTLWHDRPAVLPTRAWRHPLAYAGEAAADKIQRLAMALNEAKIAAQFVAAPDQVAWLLNLRAGDLPNTPVLRACALLHADAHVDLFCAVESLDDALCAALGEQVQIHPPEALETVLQTLSGQRLQRDAASAPHWLALYAEANAIELIRPKRDVLLQARACKNACEIDGARAAHQRDGVALCRALHWLDQVAHTTEREVVETLHAFRAEQAHFVCDSFEAIAGFAANGAIVHYRVSEASNAHIATDGLLLLDSGAQYYDGTTDITRTLAIGQPSAEQCRHFTLVLKGHIRLAQARFPIGTRGDQLDAFAREALWQAGLDYDHGTGHGVGSFLSVHEGPARISKQPGCALEPGMILSNEPGYYRTGHYGIRIENLVLVCGTDGGERPMLHFETLSLAPIDRRLIEVALLTPDERQWLDAYHARVWDALGAEVPQAVQSWLSRATAPLHA